MASSTKHCALLPFDFGLWQLDSLLGIFILRNSLPYSQISLGNIVSIANNPEKKTAGNEMF